MLRGVSDEMLDPGAFLADRALEPYSRAESPERRYDETAVNNDLHKIMAITDRVGGPCVWIR